MAERIARLRETEILEQLGDEADAVIEAAIESLPLKETIFRTLDGAAGPSTMLATNTSSISIAAIATATTRPERVIGLHFFNPAPLMALVEVVATPVTDPGIAAAAFELVVGWGKTAVRSADSPGFIVNRVNRPFTLRALRLVEERIASVEVIDEAIREAGFPLGPFELMDLTGIDVTFAASTGIWEALGRPDRLRPSPIQERMVAEGTVGRKTGSGFYRYEGGKAVGLNPDVAIATTGSVAADAIRQRILLPLIDEAFRVASEGVAAKPDIDVAMRLGAAHPMGPFERVVEAGGAAAVAARLRELARDDPSFSPSSALDAAH
ncbi:MAG: 3-hydroxyacyl-CoA dehydrogenase [Chloroflexi bacterium]|nr:3-hydroxyacyl-CoA dehydrogenase [Chloroflexota bacterium]